MKKIYFLCLFGLLSTGAFGQYFVMFNTQSLSMFKGSTSSTSVLFGYDYKGSSNTTDSIADLFSSGELILRKKNSSSYGWLIGNDINYEITSGNVTSYYVSESDLSNFYSQDHIISHFVLYSNSTTCNSKLYFKKKFTFNSNTDSCIMARDLGLVYYKYTGCGPLPSTSCFTSVKSRVRLIIHPTYNISISDSHFIKEGNSLSFKCSQKGTKKINTSMYVSNEMGLINYSNYYNIDVEVCVGSNPSAWVKVSDNTLTDPNDQDCITIPYYSLISGLGGNITGKEIRVRLKQKIDSKTIYSNEVSFYYLPALTINSHDIKNVSCYNGNTGSATFHIGNLPSSSGIAAYTYLVYQYSENGSTAPADIRVEDRTIDFNGHTYKFETAIVSADDKTLTQTVSIPNLPKGIYKIKVYSSYSETRYYPAEEIIEITEPPALQNSSHASNNWNNTYQVATGASTASITIAASGGTSGYQYSLDGVTYNTFASPYPVSIPVSSNSTTANITIKDANGCLSSSALTLKRAENITVGTMPEVTSTCNQNDIGYSKDGLVSFSFSGGTGKFRISVKNTNTNDSYIFYQNSAGTFSSYFDPGNYSVSIRDTTQGPEVPGSFIVKEPDQLIVSGVTLPAIHCYNDNASATIETQNSGVNYLAVNGSQTISSSSPIFDKKLAPGATYQFYIQRIANQCKSASISKTLPSAPSQITVQDLQVTDVSCASATNGSFMVTATGGVSYPNNQYSYDVGNGSGYVQAANGSRINLGKGTYTVKIKDALCEAPSTEVIDINEVASQLRILDPVITNDICRNRETGMPTGTVALTIDKGTRATSGYTANLTSLQGKPVYIGSIAGNNYTFTGLKHGSYTLMVNEANNCTDSRIVTVGIVSDTIKLASQPVVDNTLCKGISTGKITLKATGGTPGSGYKYRLTDGTGKRDSLVSSVATTFTGLAQGNYSLRVLDANTCYVNDVATVKANPSPVSFSNVASTHIFCDNRKGTVTTRAITTSSGIDSIILFYPNAISQKISSNANAYVSGLKTPGRYTLRAIDTKGCASDTSVYLKDYKNYPEITLSGLDSAACGTASNGSFLFKASQDTAVGGFVFQLSASPAITNAVTVTPPDDKALFTGLLPRTYYIKVADSMGCFNIDTLALPVIHEPANIKSFTVDSASCIRAANARVALKASGSIPGKEGYYFVLEQDTLYGSDVAFTGQAVGGPHRVYLYDRYGCSANTPKFSFPVRLDTIRLLFSGRVNPSCPGYNNGSMSLVTAGNDSATNGYTYRVYNTAGNSLVLTQKGGWKEKVNSLGAGTYQALVTAADNCSAASEHISLSDPDTVKFTVNPGYVAAKGASTGCADAIAISGNRKYVLEWYKGLTADASALISRDTTFSSSGIKHLPAGDYLVRVKDTSNCRFWNTEWLPKPFTILEPATALSLSLVRTDTVSCNGLSDGRFILQGVGGWGNQYAYDNGTSFTRGYSSEFTGLNAGTYTYYVKDTAGVTATATYVMPQPDVLKASVASVQNANCHGSSDGSIALSVTGGNKGYEVSGDGAAWVKGLTLPSLTAGSYTVMVRDRKNCKDQAVAVVAHPDALVVTDTTITDTQCKAKEGSISTVVAGGVPGYSYQWYNDNSLVDEGSAKTDSLYSGQYRLKVTDNHGCAGFFDFFVSDVTDLAVDTIITRAVSCWGGSDGEASAIVSKGFPPYSLLWNNTVKANSINGLVSGRYPFHVSDSEGCKVYRTFTIGTPDSLHLTGNISHPLCYGVTDGSIQVQASGGTPSYSWLWSNGKKKDNVSRLDTGLYTVTLTDSHGCTNERKFRLGYQERINSGIPTFLSLCRNNSYTLDGGDFASYLWKLDNTELSSDRRYTIASEGKYTLEFEDLRGCRATDIIKVGMSQAELNAQFLMASQVQQSDTVVIFEASEPVPDSIRLKLPESFVVLDSGQYYRNVIVRDTGIFEISMIAYNSGCEAVVRKPIQVTERGLKKAMGQSAKESLIVSASLAPNPSDGNFNVEVRLLERSDIYLRLVSFATGSTVDIRKVSGSGIYNVPYSVGYLPRGAYILNIRAGNEMKNLKFIIQ